MVKNQPPNAGDMGLIPAGKIREGNGTLQCSFLENTVDRGAWQATMHGVTDSLDVTEHDECKGEMWRVAHKKHPHNYN